METFTGRHGAVARSELVSRLGERQVRRGLEAGRWLVPWPGVLVEPTRAGDPLTLAAAALVAGGPDSVITGPTAAFFHGISAVSPTPVHILVPYDVTCRRRQGLVVHNGSSIAADRTDLDGLPVLTFDRVVSDLACTAGPAEALAVLDQALASVPAEAREALRARLATRLSKRPDPRGTRRAMRLLDIATGRAESPAESWLLWRIVDSGFPIPDVNVSVLTIDGRELYRVDIAWPDLRIAVEYYGYASHAERSEEDRLRVADLERRGWLVIEVWLDDLTDPRRLLGALESAFARRGVDMTARQTRLLRGRRHRDGDRRAPTRGREVTDSRAGSDRLAGGK